jgi:membrane-anchored protein YejM (alkaline phosphatase superfamily)
MFEFTTTEINEILQKVKTENEIDYTKILHITAKNGTIFAELDKTLYIATKAYYKEKRGLKV